MAPPRRRLSPGSPKSHAGPSPGSPPPGGAPTVPSKLANQRYGIKRQRDDSSSATALTADARCQQHAGGDSVEGGVLVHCSSRRLSHSAPSLRVAKLCLPAIEGSGSSSLMGLAESPVSRFETAVTHAPVVDWEFVNAGYSATCGTGVSAGLKLASRVRSSARLARLSLRKRLNGLRGARTTLATSTTAISNSNFASRLAMRWWT